MQEVSYSDNVSTLDWKVAASNLTDAVGWASGPILHGKLLVIFGSIKIKSAVITIGWVRLPPRQWPTNGLEAAKRLIKKKKVFLYLHEVFCVTVEEPKFYPQAIGLQTPIRYSYLKGVWSESFFVLRGTKVNDAKSCEAFLPCFYCWL